MSRFFMRCAVVPGQSVFTEKSVILTFCSEIVRISRLRNAKEEKMT